MPTMPQKWRDAKRPRPPIVPGFLRRLPRVRLTIDRWRGRLLFSIHALGAVAALVLSLPGGGR